MKPKLACRCAGFGHRTDTKLNETFSGKHNNELTSQAIVLNCCFKERVFLMIRNSKQHMMVDWEKSEA